MVFSLGSAISVQKFFEEISGIFYDGGSEKNLKTKLKDLYSQVRQTAHGFMLVLNHPPRQIRVGWQTIVYPPDQTGEVIAGGTKVKRHVISSGILKKNELFKQAVALGFPKYLWKTVTPKILENYLQQQTAQGQKQAGNTAPEIESLINQTNNQSTEWLRKRMMYRIRRYKQTGSLQELRKIEEYANQIYELDPSMSDQVKFMISRAGITDQIQYD